MWPLSVTTYAKDYISRKSYKLVLNLGHSSTAESPVCRESDITGGMLVFTIPEMPWN